MTIVTLATITILETLRRRVIAIVGVASLALVVAIGWGFHRISEAIEQPIAAIGTEAVLTILLAFAFSVVLAVGASFLAAPAIASDLESGVALALLPRPLSRSAYVLGKWLGLASLVVVYGFAFGALAFAAIAVGSGYRAPNEIAALFFLTAQSLALFTFALALSTRLAPIAAGIVAVGFFGIAWIAGITAAIARALNADALAHFATFTGLVIPTDGLWRGAVYALTPAAMLVAQDTIRQRGLNPFGVNEPPSTAFLIWSAVWIAAVLGTAVASMQTRDV